ncbi:MAG: DNA recombination protein RmuC [Ignavibacteria bacterium]|nr:DNA recombination protein RmuC [Ignavibacteria bacterium]
METLIIVMLSVICVLLVIMLINLSGNRDKQKFIDLENRLAELSDSVRGEFNVNRTEINSNIRDSRQEMNQYLTNFGDSVNKRISEIAGLQKNQLDTFSSQLVSLTKINEDKFSKVIETLENRLKSLQDDNNVKLEKMRETVDEKLQTTLEKRLGESFRLVSERLELVHKGLGEMQNLAAGVGDIKKVLSNIKTKGVLGEYQLENILEQILTPEQFSKNVKTKPGSNALVEFAVKLPGRDSADKTVWLPLDSKFPTEDYQILLDAYDSGNAETVIDTKKILVKKIKDFAKGIRDKYIDPPNTTDFAILFLPFEGLYAEVLNNAGLFETIQREYKITITGPTTLSAFLSSLQMGFRTLAIEKRSSEVWEILGAVKTEFANYASVLEQVKKKLEQAADSVDKAGVRTRAIEKKLKDVQALPSSGEEVKLISDNAGSSENE